MKQIQPLPVPTGRFKIGDHVTALRVLGSSERHPATIVQIRANDYVIRWDVPGDPNVGDFPLVGRFESSLESKS